MLQSLKVIFRHEQLLMPEVYTVHYMHVAKIKWLTPQSFAPSPHITTP